MAQLIRLPALSPTMETGTLAKWYVSEGDQVEPGDLLADIETDKASMEFEAIDSGAIGKILIAAGTEMVKVNEPIAVLLEDGEAMPEDLAALTGGEAAPAAASAQVSPTPTADEVETSADANLSQTERSQSLPVAGHTQASMQSNDGTRIFVSPLARRIAAAKNIDLQSITGSGPHGRIIKADVESFSASAAAPSVSSILQTNILAQYEGREFTSVPLDGMRKTVAARLSEAKSTIPHFYLRRNFAIDSLLALRASTNEILAKQELRISINDFVIRAAAIALQQVPEANAIWAGDQILQFKPSDIAVAVAIDGGLLTPVIRDAESKSVQQLSIEMKALAKKAKSRKLMPAEYTGGTFSISNLGMFGIDNFDAVINPPHASILAVGAAQRSAIENEDGSVGFATLMSVTLSCDHRVIDGAIAAQFLAAIAGCIENPLSMLL